MKKLKVPRYLVTSPSRFNKNTTVHNSYCRYFTTANGRTVESDEIPPEAVNCKICGGRT